MKILFVWRKIDQVAGGVERMITTMMNEMVKRGHEASLLTWDQKNAVSYYKMDKSITWHRLNTGDPTQKASWITRVKRVPKVRKIVKEEKPDVIMCFESGIFLSIKLFLLGFHVPLIAAERNAPSRLDIQNDGKNKKAVLRTLNLADRITVQFERYREVYPEYLRKRITAIHNPVAPASRYSSPKGNGGETKTLLTVSRLAYQKNIDVLIKAFAELAPTHPNWNLVIAGDGEDREKLENLINEAHIEKRTTLLGDVKDVQSLYCDAHLFCLPSRWEGFPNALAEAMTHGLPAVGFSECSGVCDLIKHEETGLLAQGNDDAHSLAQILGKLMGNDDERESMGKDATKSMEQYHPKLVFDQWEKFFKNVTGKGK